MMQYVPEWNVLIRHILLQKSFVSGLAYCQTQKYYLFLPSQTAPQKPGQG